MKTEKHDWLVQATYDIQNYFKETTTETRIYHERSWKQMSEIVKKYSKEFENIVANQRETWTLKKVEIYILKKELQQVITY